MLWCWCVAAVCHAAAAHSGAQEGHPAPYTVAAHRAVSQRRATGASGVCSVGAAKTLVRRDVALVNTNSDQCEAAHGGAFGGAVQGGVGRSAVVYIIVQKMQIFSSALSIWHAGRQTRSEQAPAR